MTEPLATGIVDLADLTLAELGDLTEVDLAPTLDDYLAHLDIPGASISGYNGAGTGIS